MRVSPEHMPRHVGIIMDGNGRWAKKRGLPRSAGHRQGAKVFEEIVRYASGIGLSYLTVYAFSKENRKRPADEVQTILSLLREYIVRLEKSRSKTGKILFLGDIGWLDADLREHVRKVELESANREGMQLNVAFNYGGRDEILRAAKELILSAPQNLDEIDESDFSEFLYTRGQPDVDLVIRTSGEMRISNFLLWQSAYAEYLFTDTLWPDFSSEDLDAALEDYSHRERRMGGI